MRSAVTVLEQVPGFAGAKVVAQLSDGPTNASFEIEQGGERFVLRTDKPAAAEFGLERTAEREVIAALAAAGLGERAVYFDAQSGIYLRSFMPGRSWTAEDLQNPSNLERLAELLKRVHRLPPAGPLFDPVGAASRYAAQLGTAEAREIFRDIEREFPTLKADRPVLCHNDLVHTNMLESDQLMLIDWEWAGGGDSFFDLAVVVQHHGLCEDLVRGFLASYLGREPVVSELERLDRQRHLYQLLLNLWNLLWELR